MTDFYPIIRRAISELDTRTIEERHAVYEHARNTLAQLLRCAEPLPTASEIVGTCLELEAAINRVEAPYSFVEQLSHLPLATRAALESTLDTLRRVDGPPKPQARNRPSPS